MVLQAQLKAKRKREISSVPVVSCSETVLVLLRRLRPALRAASDPDDLRIGDGASAAPSKIPSDKDQKKQRRRHSRQNVPWEPGRGLVAVGVNECTRLLGQLESLPLSPATSRCDITTNWFRLTGLGFVPCGVWENRDASGSVLGWQTSWSRAWPCVASSGVPRGAPGASRGAPHRTRAADRLPVPGEGRVERLLREHPP